MSYRNKKVKFFQQYLPMEILSDPIILFISSCKLYFYWHILFEHFHMLV